MCLYEKRGSCNIMTNQKKTKTVCVQPAGQDYFSWKAALCLRRKNVTRSAGVGTAFALHYFALWFE